MPTPCPARSKAAAKTSYLMKLKEGMVFYFEQSDNLSGKANYRMHISQASEDKNVSVMRYLVVTLFHPGEIFYRFMAGILTAHDLPAAR